MDFKTRNQQYVQKLSDQSRQKRELTRRDSEYFNKKQKEENFSVYMGGANERRIRDLRVREQVSHSRERSKERTERKQWSAPRSSVISKPEMPIRNKLPPQQLREQPQQLRERKKWNLPEPVEKSSAFDTYSDDAFEQEDDSSPEKCNEYSPVRKMIDRADPADIEILKQSLKNIPQLMEEERRNLRTAAHDPAEDLIRKIKAMDKGNIEQLARYIDDMETKQKLKPVMHKTKRPPSSRQSTTSISGESLAVTRQSTVLNSDSTPTSRKSTIDNEMCIRIVSTWGDAYVAGLSGIELLDMNGELVKQVDVQLKHNVGSTLSNPSKLLDAINNTTDDKHMWLGCMPAPPLCLELAITFPSGTRIGGIRLWNYNKSLIESVKGVKEVEIFVCDMPQWAGTVNRGNGRETVANATNIPISGKFNFPVLSDPPQEVQPALPTPQNVEESQDERPGSVPVWYQKPIKVSDRAAKKASPVQEESKQLDRHDSQQSVLKKYADRRNQRKLQDVQEYNTPKNSMIPQPNSSGREEKKDDSPILPLKIANSRRAKLPEQYVELLKESLESLEVFKLTNLGRITGQRERKKPTAAQVLEPKVLPPIIAAAPAKEERKIEIGAPLWEALAEVSEEDSLDKFMNELPGMSKPRVDPIPKATKIPYLPRGRELQIVIRSTWGDQHYVGLSGIEIWNEIGSQIKIDNPMTQITANPSDINILPGYGSDPRTVDKLVDSNHWTCDDLHVWLAPFTEGNLHTVTMDLQQTSVISMIRIWNYNKSRIHSYRGAKDVEILLDGTPIFRGEIERAPGRITNADQKCEYILFTKEPSIMQRIERTDWVKAQAQANSLEMDAELMTTIRIENRPGTGSKDPALNPVPVSMFGEDGRPLTIALTEANLPQFKKSYGPVKRPQPMNDGVIGKDIRIEILQTWGDAYYTGLTGIEVLGPDGQPVTNYQITALPQDMNVIPGYSGDYRTLDKLTNGQNQTTDDRNMWLIPFTNGQAHQMEIKLSLKTKITGLRVWNYNKNDEDTYRGIKRIAISIDRAPMTADQGIVLRKAPGNAQIDFGQLIPIPYNEGWSVRESQAITKQPVFASERTRQEYETPYLPMGFTLKMRFLSTWGDKHYVGLNGVEVYDQLGSAILTQPGNEFVLVADPCSVNSLSGQECDVRTVDKLYDGVYETEDDRHMWLAPFNNYESYYSAFGGSQKPNQVTFTFDKQICLGAIKFWNYAKTFERGAKEVEICLDELIIYRGYLRAGGSSTVLFSGEMGQLSDDVAFDNSKLQEVIMYNERRLVGGKEVVKDESERPTTSIVGHNK